MQAGTSLYKVQKVLRLTPTLTQRYAHLPPGHLKDATDALDAMLSDKAATPQSTKAEPEAARVAS